MTRARCVSRISHTLRSTLRMIYQRAPFSLRSASTRLLRFIIIAVGATRSRVFNKVQSTVRPKVLEELIDAGEGVSALG